MINRIGILTGGGDCPGLNAVIRAVVKTAIQHYNWEVYGIVDGFDGLINTEKMFRMDINSVRGILPRGGTILGTSNRGNPFKFPVKERDEIVIKDFSGEILKNLLEKQIDGLIVIGGDGTLNIAYQLFKCGASIVGVPKTIDNDLSMTDYTFGFFTAVNTASEAIDKLHTTAESHHRIMIIEVMGRDAGWIALNSGIAGGADIILIPEIPFDFEKIIEKINLRKEKQSQFSIIVVAEGAFEKGRDKFYIEKAKNEGILPRYGGIGNYIASKLTDMTDMEVRTTVLGHVQRGGSPTPFDRILASRFGVEACDLIAQKKFGFMVSLNGKDITSVPIEKCINRQKLVDPYGQLIETARRLQIEMGD
ncbi:MAG: 6-phosphofructokinase [bacterium (Candidatus Stahlbacteria) CG23_combo_of_CG06-09_8_20_14_all_34_7]|nr:MAG: 6-phosphofructokinase [bacterium (Candidatus Stahlbacteria) CG23_combo_of_CG06-09_8_20_14_all_34_7]